MSGLVVIKYGSASVTNEQGMDVYRLAHHAAQVAALAARHQIILVSSGSVAAGRAIWRRQSHRQDEPDMQTAAMLGSAEVARSWQRALGEHGLAASQLLVTHHELHTMGRQSSLSKALRSNLEHRVIPVVNENDALSEQELAKLMYGGDNDGLGAHIATAMQAVQLLLLTETPAVLDDTGSRLPEVVCTAQAHRAAASLARGGNKSGRGGMASKITAATKAALAGCAAHIGAADADIDDIIFNRSGTYFVPETAGMRVE